MSNLAVINQNEFEEESYSFEELSTEIALLSEETMTLESKFYYNKELIEKLQMLTSDSSDEIKEAIEELSELYDEAEETAGNVDTHAFHAEMIIESFEQRKNQIK